MSTDRLPRVPISEFKANPARFLTTGAVVTNHGKERATFLPLDVQTDAEQAAAAKDTLRLLYRVQSTQDAEAEAAELSAERNHDWVEPPT